MKSIRRAGANPRRYSADELRAMQARGESRSDLARVVAMTEAEIDAATRSDPAWQGVADDWADDAVLVIPGAKRLISLRLSPDVIDWFRAQGPGYQTRMNAVLEAYVRSRQGKHAG
jgi:uncharacterized protein (DUF4415 family)